MEISYSGYKQDIDLKYNIHDHYSYKYLNNLWYLDQFKSKYYKHTFPVEKSNKE